MLEIFGSSKNTVDAFYEIKNYLVRTNGIKIGELLQKYNLILKDQEEAQRFFDLLMLAANNSRKWENKGYTPDEMIKLSANKQPKEPVMNERKKIGPNERCPCGSGKKYKKCCSFLKLSGMANLSYNECELFYNTWYKLLLFVNQKYSIVKTENKTMESFFNDDAQLYKIREKLWTKPQIIKEFLCDTKGLNDEEIRLLQLWEKYHIKGKFLLVKYEPEFAVLMKMQEGENSLLYAVKGLKTSIAEIMHRQLPVMLETVLLPFKDKIIYDSFFSSHNVNFGNGIQKIFEDEYTKAKALYGIITKF